MSGQDDIEQIMDEGVALLAALTVGLADSHADTITAPIGCNLGAKYIGEKFALRDYCWCDFGSGFHEDADPSTSIHDTPDGRCPPNFEHYASGVSLRWYKRMGRSHEWEKAPATRGQAIAILAECLQELRDSAPSRLSANAAAEQEEAERSQPE